MIGSVPNAASPSRPLVASRGYVTTAQQSAVSPLGAGAALPKPLVITGAVAVLAVAAAAMGLSRVSLEFAVVSMIAGCVITAFLLAAAVLVRS